MRQCTARATAPQVVNSYEINRRVLASDLNPVAARILLVILDHARHGQSVCTASSRTIAREARTTERHVRRVLPDLQGRGLILITRATGSTHSRHTITVGPCIHQVGRKIPLKLHEVGHGVREVGHPEHLGDTSNAHARDELKVSDKDGLFLLPEEEIDPWTRLWFGAPPASEP